jgi:hypothetical protein
MDKVSNNATIKSLCNIVSNVSVFMEPNGQLCSSSCVSALGSMPCNSIVGFMAVHSLICLKDSNEYCLNKEIVPSLVSNGFDQKNSASLPTSFLRFATNKTTACTACAVKMNTIISNTKSAFQIDHVVLTAALGQMNETCDIKKENLKKNSDKTIKWDLFFLFLVAQL